MVALTDRGAEGILVDLVGVVHAPSLTHGPRPPGSASTAHGMGAGWHHFSRSLAPL